MKKNQSPQSERQQLVAQLLELMGWDRRKAANLLVGSGLRIWQLRALVGVLDLVSTHVSLPTCSAAAASRR